MAPMICAVKVEPEVVAGGEIREPAVSDPDHAPIDFVDDGVHHRMPCGQL